MGRTKLRQSKRNINFSNITASRTAVKLYLTKDEIPDHWAFSLIYADMIVLASPPRNIKHLISILNHESLHLVFANRLSLKEGVLAHALIDESTLMDSPKGLSGVALVVANRKGEDGSIIAKAYYAAPWKKGILSAKQKSRMFHSLSVDKSGHMTWKEALQTFK